MRSLILVLAFSFLWACASEASNTGSTLPEGAKPLTGPEIKSFLAGRTFRFVVYDASKSPNGTSTWNSERGLVFGEYIWDNQDPKRWQRVWFIQGGRNCTQSDGKEPECQNIYADGDRFFEVTDGGVLHAISIPVK